MMIQISKLEDMQTVATILFKNGYQVRLVKVKENAKAVTYIEAIKGGATNE